MTGYITVTGAWRGSMASLYNQHPVVDHCPLGGHCFLTDKPAPCATCGDWLGDEWLRMVAEKSADPAVREAAWRVLRQHDATVFDAAVIIARQVWP